MTTYRNPWHATKVMLQTEGVAAFYTGLGAVLAAAAPAQALYFCGEARSFRASAALRQAACKPVPAVHRRPN